ncbi:hypothetical protein [Dyella sp.]|uniref:hypothetical protein n=1 Tax=Dyella sp. TaxID=1869338 RepID=UPI00283CAEC6|nr:hypothetical protein [Dyella sp.]MDR3445143.1 hypothetical protein [Dyella sp.]
MTTLSPEQLVEIARTLTLGVLLCSLLAWWIGGLFAHLSREGILLFLSRSRRWQRFRRADARRYRTLARQKSPRVVLMLSREQALNLLRADGLPEDISPELWASLIGQCALMLSREQALNLLRADGLPEDISPELWASLIGQCARFGVRA